MKLTRWCSKKVERAVLWCGAARFSGHTQSVTGTAQTEAQ